MTLFSALPVPSTAAVPVKISFATLPESVAVAAVWSVSGWIFPCVIWSVL